MDDFSFHVADYIVGALVLVVPVAIGVVYAVKDKDKATREEYLLGGRKMHVLPVAMSLFITFQSAVSQIGVPAEVYSFGSMFIPLAVGYSLSYVVGVVTVIPLMYPLRLTSIYQYLQMRYQSHVLRTLCTLSGMLATLCYMAIALLSPALALQHSAGIPLWMSVVIVGALGTFYTAIGGIKSVIWTDAFQTIIVFIGIFTMMIKGVVEVGGVSDVWETSLAGGRTTMDTIDPDPRTRHTYLGCLIGGCVLWLGNSFQQSTLQRMAAMKSLKKAKQAFLMNIPTIIVYYVVLVVLGNIIYAYLAHTRCDPLKAGLITNVNQVAPFFVLDAMHDLPGLPGLYVSTLCCGSLSTLSSGINSLAANTVEDILARPLRRLKESSVTLITKVCALVYGVVIVALAYSASSLQGPVTQMATSVFSAFGSPVMGIFLMGGCVPWVNKYGAIAGGIVSLAFNLWWGLGSRLYGRKLHTFAPVSTEMCFANSSSEAVSTDATLAVVYQVSNFTQAPVLYNTGTTTSDSVYDYGFFLYDISYEWLSAMGVVICALVGVGVSFATKSKQQETDPELLFPFLRKLWKTEETKDTHEKCPLQDQKTNGDFAGNGNSNARVSCTKF